MSKLMSLVGRSLILCSCIVFLAGCNPAASTDTGQHAGHDHAGHDHGDGHAHVHPDNYGDLVHEIEHLAGHVLDAFAEGNGEAADGDLHEVGHLLEDVVMLAEKAGIEGEELAEITAAKEKVFVAFGALDETIHGNDSGEEIDIAQVTADAKDGIAILHTHEPEGSGHHDHDHDHDGHDHDDDDHDHDDHDDHDHDDHDE